MGYFSIVIFLSLLTALLTALNYFVLARLLPAFGYGSLIVLLLSLFPAALFVFATAFSRISKNLGLRAVYYFSASWLGISFISFFVFLFVEVILKIIPLPSGIFPVCFTIVLAGLSAGFINSFRVIIRKTNIDFPKKLKAVQISDVHYGIVNGDGYLRRLVKLANRQDPDVVFITGDLVDGTVKLGKGVFKALKELKAPAFFITGNHEFFDGFEKIVPLVEEAGITVLRDSAVIFRGIRIIGVDYSSNKNKLEKVLSSIGTADEIPTILLQHEPLYVKTAEKHGIALMLSGHTHDGQIIPFNLIVRARYRMIKGLYRSGKTSVFVSRGAGTWGPKFRLGSTSEINVLYLGSESH